MKRYEIALVYKDNQDLKLTVDAPEVEKFFKSLSDGQIYMHPETHTGFWSHIGEIRYLTIKPMQEEEKAEETKESKEANIIEPEVEIRHIPAAEVDERHIKNGKKK